MTHHLLFNLSLNTIYRVSQKKYFSEISGSQIHLKILDRFGPFWTMLDHFVHLREFWTIFYHFLPFWTIWTILDHIGPFGPFGPFLTILASLYRFGPVWTVWAVLDHFGPFGPFWTV